jgi:hypothetical protein
MVIKQGRPKSLLPLPGVLGTSPPSATSLARALSGPFQNNQMLARGGNKDCLVRTLGPRDLWGAEHSSLPYPGWQGSPGRQAPAEVLQDPDDDHAGLQTTGSRLWRKRHT